MARADRIGGGEAEMNLIEMLEQTLEEHAAEWSAEERDMLRRCAVRYTDMQALQMAGTPVPKEDEAQIIAAIKNIAVTARTTGASVFSTWLVRVASVAARIILAV
jgi:hypothetical protein